jgi:hypothetical protein
MRLWRDERSRSRLAFLEAIEKGFVPRENFLLLLQIRIKRPHTHFVCAPQQNSVRPREHIEVSPRNSILDLGLRQEDRELSLQRR